MELRYKWRDKICKTSKIVLGYSKRLTYMKKYNSKITIENKIEWVLLITAQNLKEVDQHYI